MANFSDRYFTPDDLLRLNMSDALEVCDGLDSDFRRELLEACPPNYHRCKFALRVVENLVIPTPKELSIGISQLTTNYDGKGSIGDTGQARIFILKKLQSQKNNLSMTNIKNNSWNNWFYPEYESEENNRKRLIKIAEDHVKLGWPDLMQITLFSLNGYLDWGKASSSAECPPPPPPSKDRSTTCALFVRACRAAARLLERQEWYENCNFTGAKDAPTITKCVAGPYPEGSVIRYASRGDREPQPGDIFITEPKGRIDHTGIILKHSKAPNGDWIWDTAEGGQIGGTRTELFTGMRLPYKDGWHYHGKGDWVRKILSWVDIDTLGQLLGNPTKKAC